MDCKWNGALANFTKMTPKNWQPRLQHDLSKCISNFKETLAGHTSHYFCSLKNTIVVEEEFQDDVVCCGRQVGIHRRQDATPDSSHNLVALIILIICLNLYQIDVSTW